MDSVYRKGLTIGDARNREFKVYEKPKENNFVDKIIIQFKKSNMKNDYGVYTGDIKAGTDQWVKEEMPLELSTSDDCIDNLSFDQAITVAEYLTQTEGASFAPGRPGDRNGPIRN